MYAAYTATRASTVMLLMAGVVACEPNSAARQCSSQRRGGSGASSFELPEPMAEEGGEDIEP